MSAGRICLAAAASALVLCLVSMTHAADNDGTSAMPAAAIAPTPPAPSTPPTPGPSPENKDLELIPQAAQPPTSPQGSAAAPASALPAASQRLYLEGAFTVQSLRGGLLVPLPPPAPYDWQERALLDVRKLWELTDRLSVSYSDRLNVRAENDIEFPNHENLINELREAYLSWQPRARSYIDVGRINLRSGVALGYNPTDFFKTRAVVEPLSADPTVLREDRLGALMARWQQIFDHGSLIAAFAPRLYTPSPIYNNLDLPSFNPMLDRTNAETRLLLKGSATISANFSPELLLYREGNQSRVGLNLTQSVGQRSVAYIEWSGGARPALSEQALGYARQSGTLPPSAPILVPLDVQQRFQGELALGASYTLPAPVSFNLEYHFNQAAFTATDWVRWFMLGRASAASSLIAGELWYVREYAADQQQPISRHSLFLRADWTDAFVTKLELSGFIDTDLHDGSSLLQLGIDYYLSDRWTVGGLVIGYLGARHSDYGSLPLTVTALLELMRYL